MRRIPRLLVVPVGLLLLAPAGAAHAAKANPWSAYFPAKGVTCTSTATHADGTTETRTSKVLSKSATKVVTRDSRDGRITNLLLPGGRLKQTSSETDHDTGLREHAETSATFPSPAKLLHHGRGSGELTMSMAMSAQMAKATLTHGRTLTVIVTIHLRGAGARTITLADPGATRVAAVGVRTSLGSITLPNAKPAFKRTFIKAMRSELSNGLDTVWLAQGRGEVEEDSTDVDGSALVEKQVSCS